MRCVGSVTLMPTYDEVNGPGRRMAGTLLRVAAPASVAPRTKPLLTVTKELEPTAPDHLKLIPRPFATNPRYVLLLPPMLRAPAAVPMKVLLSPVVVLKPAERPVATLPL